MFLCDMGEAAEGFRSKIDEDDIEKIRRIADEVQSEFSNPLSYIIGVSRSKVVDRLLDTVYLKDITAVRKEAAQGLRTRSAIFAGIVTLLAAVLYSVYGRDTLSGWGLHPLPGSRCGPPPRGRSHPPPGPRGPGPQRERRRSP